MAHYFFGIHQNFYLCVVLIALFSACAYQPPHQTLEDSPSTTTLTEQINDPQDKEEVQEEQIVENSEFFSAIPLSDIAIAQAKAKQHILPHWPKIADRSRYVRHHFSDILDRLDAPAALQAVPVIESGYNAYALSHAGAMGLWQLMPRTARGLGVRNHEGHNGRRDVIPSTEAAIEYLLELHQRFGNWPLALAAYNFGPTALSKRLKKEPWVPEDGLKTLPAPWMTRAYVQHVIGFAALLHTNAVKFPDPIPTKEIRLHPPVDLQQLASLSGLEDGLLFKLNPGLNQSQYLKQPVSIHLPESEMALILSNIEATAPKYVRTPIAQGDSLWSLARRHHTTIKHLRSLNPDLGKVLSIGKTLKVPADTPGNQFARAKPAPNPFLNRGRRIYYKVRAGDSLWIIAKRFGTTPKAIARSNQMSQNKLIRPGERLWILARIQPS